MEEILHHVPRIYFFLHTIYDWCLALDVWIINGDSGFCVERSAHPMKQKETIITVGWLIYVGDECLWTNMNQPEFDGHGIEIEEVLVAGWIGTKFPWTEPQEEPNPDRPLPPLRWWNMGKAMLKWTLSQSQSLAVGMISRNLQGMFLFVHREGESVTFLFLGT